MTSPQLTQILPRYTVGLEDKHVSNQLEMKFDLLERLLHERNYDGAASVYSTLLGDIKAGDGLTFTIGFLLIQLIDRLNNTNVMKNFFRTIVSHMIPTKVTSARHNFIILESLLFTLRNGDVVSADFMLQDQLHAEHISKDSVFHAMSGIISFRKFLADRGHSFSTWMNWKLDDPDTPTNDIDSPEVKAAIQHMQRALAMKPSNTTYLYYLCLFLLQDGEERQCVDTCKTFCKNNPDVPLGFLIRAKVLRKIDSDGTALKEAQCWRTYLLSDPGSDEAFLALLMHYKQQKVGIAVMLRVLMSRMDVVPNFCESLAAWKLFAALIVSRERALASKEHAKIGTVEDDREFMTELYTWRQRYWSPEAWRLQTVEMNTATKITVVLCCMLIFGKTPYTLHAIHELTPGSESDLRFHMAPFGAIPLLEQHLALVSRIRVLKATEIKKKDVFAEELRVTGTEAAKRLMNPQELENAELVFQRASEPIGPVHVPIDSDYQTSVIVDDSHKDEERGERDSEDAEESRPSRSGVQLGSSGRLKKRQRDLSFYGDDEEPEAPVKHAKTSDTE